MYIYDGQEYQEKKDIPNLGSIRCTNASKENVRNYILKEEDTSKLLNIVTYVGDGSTARVVDGEQDFYTFLCGKWYKA